VLSLNEARRVLANEARRVLAVYLTVERIRTKGETFPTILGLIRRWSLPPDIVFAQGTDVRDPSALAHATKPLVFFSLHYPGPLQRKLLRGSNAYAMWLCRFQCLTCSMTPAESRVLGLQTQVYRTPDTDSLAKLYCANS
jgi:hypothetical protein